MEIDELINKLQEMNTGANRAVLVRDDKGHFWEPRVAFERIRVADEEPYEADDDSPMTLFIAPNNEPI